MVAVDASSRLAIEMVLRDLASKDLKKFGGLVGRTSKRAGKDFGAVSKSVQKVSRRLVGMVAGIFAIRAAFGALRKSVGAGFGFVKASANFEESVSKFEVVFGDFAQSTARDLDLLADAVGRPRTELIDFASTMQDTLVPMGFVRKEAATLSVGLVKLAIDAASFGNKLDADTIRDFQSALVGNHETVRKYGIVITEANLKQEAWTRGLTKQGEELSNIAKIQARLSLIQAGLSDAIGDAERTAGSYQNTMKRLSGVVSELRVLFGQLIQKEILDAIDKMGGLDNVVGFVKIGFGFLTGITRRFIIVASDMALGVQELIKQLGGADEVARGLAGDFFRMSVIGDVWLSVLKRMGKGTAAVFLGIEQSVEVMIDNVVFLFETRMVEGISLAMVDVLQTVTDGLRKIPLLDKVVDIPKIDDNARDIVRTLIRVTRTAEKPVRQYPQVWEEALGKVALNFLGTFDDIRAILKDVEAEGLDFDFKLENLFGDSVKIETGARTLGESAGRAFGFGFGTIAQVVLDTTLEAAMREAIISANIAAGVPAMRKSGEDGAKAWVMAFLPIMRVGLDQAFQKMEEDSKTFAGGFASGMEQVAERFSDRELGQELAFSTFGALENGLDSFSRALVEGEANFKEFSKTLLKEISAIIIKLLLMKAVQSAFGFAEGGVSSGPLTGTRSFALGGVMPGVMQGRMPVRKYAHGGIATTPQIAVFGEGKGAEAFVPLGPNRKIPVETKGDGMGTRMEATVNLTINSLDPRTATDVILRSMPEIEKQLALSLQGGRTRALTQAVRSTAQGGR